MKKLLLLFLLFIGINRSFAQNLCHEGSGGGPCLVAERLDNGSFDVVLDYSSNPENCNCPTDFRVNIKKNEQGKYITTSGSYSLALTIENDWILYLEVKRIKPESNCCKLPVGKYTEPAD